MNYYITSNGTLREISDQYLMHHGVKGMKWGKRKARPEAMRNPRSGRSANQADRNSEEAKAARKAKVKKAVKIGAAVAGTALAAYGAYKLTKFVKNKNVELATQKGEALAKKYIGENKMTIGWDGYGGRNIHQNGQIVGRTFGRQLTDEQTRSMARTVAERNKVTIDRARGIKSQTIRDATKDSFSTAAKNVGSHYAGRAKSAIASTEVGKRAAAASSMVKDASERVREEYLRRLNR